jgi:hypothetical protein
MSVTGWSVARIIEGLEQSRRLSADELAVVGTSLTELRDLELEERGVRVGLGRIIALHHCASTSYQIH